MFREVWQLRQVKCWFSVYTFFGIAVAVALSGAPWAWGGDTSSYPEVRVPRIVREDLLRQAVDFYAVAYPDVPRETVREKLAHNLEKKTWQVYISSLYGCRTGLEIKDTEKDEVVVGFPDGGPRKSVSTESPLGELEKEELTMEEAKKKARDVFLRLVPQPEAREGYKFDAFEAGVSYHCSWDKVLGADYKAYKRIRVRIRESGVLWNWSFTNRTIPVSDRPVMSREEIKEEVARVYGLQPVETGDNKDPISATKQVRDEWLKLNVGYSLGRHLLWWEYEGERSPGGGADKSVFDAASGQLISSNVRDPEGETVERYRNRGYFPWDSREEVVQRLEYLARRRAVELRHRRRQEEKKEREKQDAEPEKQPDEEGE